MIVVDASIVLDLLIGDIDPEWLRSEALAAPHLLDSEVLHVLRRMVLRGSLSDTEGRAAVETFGGLVVQRFPAAALHDRMWELRHVLSAYDATYVALAEALEVDLVTADDRLVRAPGPRCVVRRP